MDVTESADIFLCLSDTCTRIVLLYIRSLHAPLTRLAVLFLDIRAIESSKYVCRSQYWTTPLSGTERNEVYNIDANNVIRQFNGNRLLIGMW